MMVKHRPISLKVGLVIHRLTQHSQFECLMDLLSTTWISPKQLNRDLEISKVVRDCIEEGNRVLGDWPLLYEAIGPIDRTIVPELALVLNEYLECWIIGRELFGQWLDEADGRLGIIF